MASPPSSHTELCVSGLEVHVYGLKETLNSKTILADVIFTLPGRQGTYQSIERFAQEILAKDKGSAPAGTAGRGFVVVSFDQRNHGHRNVSDRANDSWDEANEMHAQDMYARVTAGVVIIGCPDYKALMSQRAGNKEKDKRLPKLFLDLVAKLDPKLENVSRKEVLILKGDEDELVPWSASQEFVGRLPNERKEVVGFPGVGHKFTDQMMAKAVSWIVEWRERH